MIEYNGVEYDEDIEARGWVFQVAYKPRIAGEIIGYHAQSDTILLQLTEPYGKGSKVFMVVPGRMVRYQFR